MRRAPRKQSTRFDPLAPPVTYKRSELKSINFALPASIGTTVVNFRLAGGITQGTDSDDRIGNGIWLQDIGFTGTLVGGQSNTVADDAYNTVRVLLLWAVADALDTSTLGTGTLVTPVTVPGLIKVLKDTTFVLQSPGTDSTGYVPAAKQVRFNYSFNSTLVAFAGTGTNKDLTGSPFLLFVTDSAINPHPGFTSGNAAIYWTDK